jgi:hypothetical protein
MILDLSPSQVPAVRRRLMALLKKIQSECARRRKKPGPKSLQWALTLAFAPTVTRTRP